MNRRISENPLPPPEELKPSRDGFTVIGVHSAGALLLDRNNPTRILRRSHEPIMQPTADFEWAGFVANVVFPTALVERGETLCVYYGASDTFTGVVEFSRKELLAALR